MRLKPLRESLANCYPGSFTIFCDKNKITEEAFDKLIEEITHETDFRLEWRNKFLDHWMCKIVPLYPTTSEHERWEQIKKMHEYFEYAKDRFKDVIKSVDADCAQPLTGRI